MSEEPNVLDEKRLSLAGWLSVISAATAIPLAILAIGADMKAAEGLHLKLWNTLLGVANLVLYVYVWLTFKRLLNLKAHFTNADAFIDFSIWTSIAITVLDLLILLFATAENALAVAEIVFVIPFGIVTIVLGGKLQKCSDDLFGYRKPLAVVMIVAGVTMATVILIPIALLAGMAMDILLAVIFFRGAKFLRESGSLS